MHIRVDAPTVLTGRASGTTLKNRDGWIVLTLDDDVARVEVPLSSVRRVDISTGRNRRRAAIIGGLISGVTSGGVGLAVGARELPGESFYPAALGVFAFVVGAPIGAIAGAVWAPKGWREAPLFTSSAADTGTARVVLRSGAKLRVTPVAGGARFSAIAVGSDVAGVRVQHDGVPATYRWSEVAQIEMRGGRDHVRGAEYGAAAGALLGAVPGGIDLSEDRINGSEYARTVLFNALIGAFAGSLISPRGWVPLPAPRAGK